MSSLASEGQPLVGTTRAAGLELRFGLSPISRLIIDPVYIDRGRASARASGRPYGGCSCPRTGQGNRDHWGLQPARLEPRGCVKAPSVKVSDLCVGERSERLGLWAPPAPGPRALTWEFLGLYPGVSSTAPEPGY